MEGTGIGTGAAAAAPPKEGKMPELRMELEAPFKFEGEEYSSIDLSGLYHLTLLDMGQIDMEVQRYGFQGSGSETSRLYAAFAAAKANGKPMEWLFNMKARDSIRLRAMVAAFFFARA